MQHIITRRNTTNSVRVHRYFSKYGVVPDPEFADYELTNNDRYLFLSSDGVTDVLAADDIVESIVHLDRTTGGNMQVLLACD